MTLLGDVQLNPDPGALPGGSTLQSFANGAAAFGLIATLIVFCIGAASWSAGRHLGNYRYAETGKLATISSALAAALIGGAAVIINFFFHAGQALH
jgi:hypothetical protein